jgi:4-phosphopantoate--beta-alanine ligase
MIEISPNHPRYWSLVIRERLVKGFEEGYVVPQGLIAHGRGECFDYLLGEVTIPPALKAIRAAAAALLISKYPVISVNGNAAALVPGEIVRLAKLINAKIEVNLFHRTRSRELKIAEVLRSYGADEVLGVEGDVLTTIPEIHSERRKVSLRGIYKADTVLVPLEDGDRTEALRRLGKTVIAIDLNPLSRTSRAASITIVDNIVRALPKLIEEVESLKVLSVDELRQIVAEYNNEEVLKEVINYMLNRLHTLSRELRLTT